MASHSDPGLAESLSRFTTFCSALAVGFGLLVLTGWALDIRILKTILPGHVTVKANTGACFILIGLALWLVRKRDQNRWWVWGVGVRVFASLVSIVGLLSFLECWYGWDLGIDHLLFSSGADDWPGSVRPGLMSPNTAVAFFFLGLATVLVDLRTRWADWLTQGLAGIVAISSIFGMLDFVLNVHTLHTHISPATAVLLFLFSFATILARAEWGLSRLLTSRGVGGTLTRRMFPAAVVVPIMVGWLGSKGYGAGLYSDWTKTAIMTASAAVLLASLTVWTALVIDRGEKERRTAEESESHLASIVNSSTDAIIGKTCDGIVTSWNRGAEAMYGYSAAEMVGRPIALLLPPGHLDDFSTIMDKIRRGEHVRHYETLRMQKDGQTIEVSLSISPMKDESGNLVGVSTVAHDISERKQAEAELRQASRYARSLLEASMDPLVTISREGKITDVNAATEKVTGVPRDRLIDSDFCDYFTEPEKARSGYEEVFARGFVQNYPLAIRHSSGQVTDVLYNASLFKNEKGEIAGVFAAARDVTARKQAEEKLQESETRFRTLANFVPQFVWMCTPDGLNVYFNQRWVEYTGLTLEESYGRGWNTPFHPEDKQAAWNAWNHATATGDTYRVESRLRAADGSYRWFLMRGVPLRDASGNIEKWFGTCTDIDDMKRAEAKLQEASLYNRSLLEASRDPLVTISREGKISDVNEATEKATGVPRDLLIGSDFCDYFTEPEKARQSYRQVFAEGFVQDYPVAIRHTSGTVMDVQYNATIFRNQQGEVAGVFAAARDITERKRAEATVVAERQKFNMILDVVSPYVVLLTPDYHVAFANREFRKRFGESGGRCCYEFLFNRTEPCEVCETYKVLKTGQALDWEWTGPDGCTYEIHDFPFTDTDGTKLILEMGIDVTARKRAQEEIRQLNQELEDRVQQRTAQLHESEQRVRRKLDSILSPEGDLGNLELADLLDIAAVQALVDDIHALTNIPIFILNLQGHVLVSAGWQEICTRFHRAHPETCRNCQESDGKLSAGVAPGAFKLYKCKNNLWDVVTPITVGGQHIGNLFSGQFFFADEPVDEALFRSQAKIYGFDEKEYLRALGRVPRLSREAVMTGMAFYTKLAQILSHLGYSGIQLARSMTETSRANTELAASMKELESFSYSVSHDLRAPLRHVSAFSKILCEEHQKQLPAEAQRYLQRIQDAIQRMGLLMDDLLNLARVGRQEIRRQLTGLNSLVDEVVKDLQPDCEGRRVEWKVASLPSVECDPAFMRQVFQNLLSNALKYTRPRSPAVIEVGVSRENGQTAIFVRDNGVGFSMKYADKLFGVFQRLHRAEEFEGTGVGLATVQRVIHKHKGKVWAEAEPDKGATFYFTIGVGESDEMKAKAANAGEGHDAKS